MALETRGVKLVLEGEQQFFAGINRANMAVDFFGEISRETAKGVDALDASVRRALRIEQLTEKLTIQQKQLGILQTELDQVSKKYGESSIQAQKKGLALDRLKQQIGGAERELLALKTATNNAANEMSQSQKQLQAFAKTGETVERAFSTLGKELKGSIGNLGGGLSQGLGAIKSSLADVGKSVKALGDTVQSEGKRVNVGTEIMKGALLTLGNMGVNALADVARSAVNFAKDTVSVASTYEKNMLRFGAVTGDSLSQAGLSLKEFSDLFLQLGKDTQFSAAQAQEAAINLAKGGIAPATIEAGGLKAALDLAAAGEVGLAEAAEITAKQYGVWVNQTASAAEQAAFLAESADLMAQAANASTVNVDDLAIGLANVGGIAKQSGLTFKETVQTMGLISAGFSSSSDAGTSFKVMLTRLQPTTKSATEAFKRLNLLTDEGKSKFYDASGAFVGMETAASLLSESLAGTSDAFKVSALSAAFGQDAFRAAALIADQGAEGFRRMGESMAGQGTAAEIAAQKNQGFAFAVDTMLGSLETFQIVAGTMVLPILTSLVNNGITPAINALTTLVTNMGDTNTTIGYFFSVLADVGTPALAGITTALIAYATVQAIQATPAILASLPAIAAQTAAFTTNAIAVAAAAAPFAAVAATVAILAYQYQALGDLANERLTGLRETQPALIAAAEAEQAYSAASKATQDALTPYNATLSVLNDQYSAAVEELTRLESYGYRTRDAAEAQRAKIAELEAQIGTTAVAMQNQTALLVSQEAASNTATARLGELTAKHPALQQEVARTEQELTKLLEALQTVYQKGGEAVGAFVETEAKFLSDAESRRASYNAEIEKLQAALGEAVTAEQREAIQEQINQAKRGFAEQESTAAASYAEQQAAQRAHLGQMLLDYTVNQALLGNIGKEEAALLSDAIATEYGIMEDNNASTFLRMTSAIDEWAANAQTRQDESAGSAQRAQQLTSESIDTLIGDLGEQEQAAVKTKQMMDEYSREYVATAVGNFVEKGIEAEDYAEQLRNIPTQINVRIRVQADPIPDDYRQRSPSPFEQSLMAISYQAKMLATQSIPELNTAVRTLSPVAESAVRSLENSLASPTIVESARNTAMDIEGAFRDVLDVHSPSPKFNNIGLDLIESLADGMDYALPLIETATGKISGSIIDAFTEMKDSVDGLLADLGGSLLGGEASTARTMTGNRKFLSELDKKISETTNPQVNLSIRTEAEQALKEAEKAADEIFARTGDRKASSDYLSYRSNQIKELANARVDAANAKGSVESNQASFYVESLQDTQGKELRAFMYDLDARAGKTQEAISGLGGLSSNVREALEKRLEYETQMARTGVDDKGNKIGNEKRAEYLIASGYTQNLLTALSPYLGFVDQVAQGNTSATAPNFANGNINLDPMGPYGGTIVWERGIPRIQQNQITTSPDGVQYGLWGYAPNFWPRWLKVPSDVSETNPIPDRWERVWQLNGGQPLYTGPMPPSLPGQLPPMRPMFGSEYVQLPNGQWEIRQLPQYHSGGANVPGGASILKAGEMIVNVPQGSDVIPAARVPSVGGYGGATNNNYWNYSPTYNSQAPTPSMEYNFMQLMIG